MYRYATPVFSRNDSWLPDRSQATSVGKLVSQRMHFRTQMRTHVRYVCSSEATSYRIRATLMDMIERSRLRPASTLCSW